MGKFLAYFWGRQVNQLIFREQILIVFIDQSNVKIFFFKEMKPYLVKGFYPLRSQTKKKFYLNFYFHISLW